MIYPYVLEFTTCAVQGVTIIFSFFYPTGKAGGTQILRYQGIASKLLRLHPWRLGSDPLRLLERWGVIGHACIWKPSSLRIFCG